MLRSHERMLGFMSRSPTWSVPPDSPLLATGEVHVWRLELTQPDDIVEEFRSTLQEAEVDRANRFHFEKHRRAFVVGRGFLRYLIGQYLGTKPEELSFSYGLYGKPALDGELRESRLRFNMSHSHELALYGITVDCELGVDVEHVRADFASDEIAHRFFSSLETETLIALPPEERVAAFFRCWTRKEAFIKATGKGLSQQLDDFDVTLAPGVEAELLRVCEGDVSRWSLRDINVGQDYAAALAVEAPILRIRHFQALA